MSPLFAARARLESAPAPDDVAEFELELRAFPLHAAPYGVILDAGCGSGDVTRCLAERFPASLVIGVDGSAERIAHARAGRRLPNVSFWAADPAQLHFDGDSIDQIVCRFALQRLAPAARRTVLREFFRVLTPGGKLAAIDFDGFAGEPYPATALLARAAREMQDGVLADLPAGRRLPDLFHAAGFHRVRRQRLAAAVQGGPAGQFHAARMSFDEAAVDAAFGTPGAGRQLRLELAACLAMPHATLRYHKAVVTAAKPETGAAP